MGNKRAFLCSRKMSAFLNADNFILVINFGLILETDLRWIGMIYRSRPIPDLQGKMLGSRWWERWS